MHVVASFFQLGERWTTFGREVRGGVTTFLAMAYILFVNPAILPAVSRSLAGAFRASLVTGGRRRPTLDERAGPHVAGGRGGRDEPCGEMDVDIRGALRYTPAQHRQYGGSHGLEAH